jgi:hypothetical protein
MKKGLVDETFIAGIKDKIEFALAECKNELERAATPSDYRRPNGTNIEIANPTRDNVMDTIAVLCNLIGDWESEVARQKSGAYYSRLPNKLTIIADMRAELTILTSQLEKIST